MDPKVEQYKVTFRNQSEQIGFKYFFKDKDLLEFLGKRPNGATVISLEQYDRKTHTFKPLEQ
jgi:hypothetical protein